MTPTEASASAALMWLEEPATGVPQAPSALAPTDANVGVIRDFVMSSSDGPGGFPDFHRQNSALNRMA